MELGAFTVSQRVLSRPPRSSARGSSDCGRGRLCFARYDASTEVAWCGGGAQAAAAVVLWAGTFARGDKISGSRFGSHNFCK